jgi:hypothetical protein
MAITTLEEYLREFSVEIGDRILTSFPALHAPGDPVSPILGTLLRKPFAAQALAISGGVKRLREANSVAIIVTLSISWPYRPRLWFNSLRPNYGLTSTYANWILQTAMDYTNCRSSFRGLTTGPNRESALSMACRSKGQDLLMPGLSSALTWGSDGYRSLDQVLNSGEGFFIHSGPRESCGHFLPTVALLPHFPRGIAPGSTPPRSRSSDKLRTLLVALPLQAIRRSKSRFCFDGLKTNPFAIPVRVEQAWKESDNRTFSGIPELTSNLLEGRRWGFPRAHPQEHGALFNCNRLEPPCTNPYARWCGRGSAGDRRPYADQVSIPSLLCPAYRL